MNVKHQPCGAVVPAVVRSVLDGNRSLGAEMLRELDEHSARHALWVAVSLAADLAGCLNRCDPGHADADIQRFALRLAGQSAS